jgi:arylsulfatase A-like enzyme
VLTATDDLGATSQAQLQVTVAPRSRPNIVLILTDDQGFGDVGYAGFANDLETPAMDAIADAGMRFGNFYANSTVCSPTRASILTGRYPALVGVPGTVGRAAQTNMGQFAPTGPTLPELLKATGYHTALIGKWHLGDRVVDQSNLPTRRGFDLYRGFLGAAGDYYTHDGSNYGWPGDGIMMNGETPLTPSQHVGVHFTDLYTPWAVDYIVERTSGQSQPFFLQLAYMAPHDPVQPPQSYLNTVLAREPGIDPDRAALVALIEHLDASIATIVQTLKDQGVYENTLIVFSSDNGGYLLHEANNGPYRGGKTDMYEGGIRVPTAISWPGRIEPGSSSEQVAASMDLYPTLAEVAGATFNHEIEGRSIVPTLLQTGATPPPRDLVFENRSTFRETRWEMIYALRRGDWKLVQDVPGGAFELYNLGTDPFETQNRAASQPTVFADLMSALDQHIARTADVPWQRQPVFEHGKVSGATGSWQTVPLANEYRAPIVIATPRYDASSPPLAVRIRGITETPGEPSNSFELRLLRAESSAAAIAPTDVEFVVFEAGVYNEAHHGVKFEAVPFVARTTEGVSGWRAREEPWAHDYVAPVVLGQILSYVDPDFSVFWSHGASVANPPGAELWMGKHVGADPDVF